MRKFVDEANDIFPGFSNQNKTSDIAYAATQLAWNFTENQRGKIKNIESIEKYIRSNITGGIMDKYSSEFSESDSCEKIRHDFGNLPVFVIDNPTAKEIDDGISLEHLDHMGEKITWVHIHIADPTVFIPENNFLSLIANYRQSSIYLPERHFSMMPDVISAKKCNLGASPYAMTFSARLSSNGDIVDFKIRPSIIRNVQFINYNEVDKVISHEYVYGTDSVSVMEKSPWTMFVLHHRKANQENPSEKALEQKGILLDLQNIARAHFHFRTRNGGILNDQPEYSLRLEPYPTEILPPLPKTSVQDFEDKCYPSIELDSFNPSYLSPSRLMVAEFMIIAGRVAAAFCFEKKVPCLYRTQKNYKSSNSFKSLSIHQQTVVDQTFRERDEISKVLPYMEFQRVLPYMLHSNFTTRPYGHSSMGIPGYNYKGKWLGG